METQQKLFTKGDKPLPIDEFEAYQLLLAEKLYRHYKAHYTSDYRKVPNEFSIDYMKYKGRLLDVRSTALKKLDGFVSKEFREDNSRGKIFSKNTKKALLKRFKIERDQHLENLLNHLGGIKYGSKYHYFTRVNNSHIENVPIRALLSDLEKDGEIKVRAHSKTKLKELDINLNKYAKSEAKIWAVKYVKDRIDTTGEFNAKWLVESVEEMFSLMFVEGKYSEADPEKVLKNLKKYVKEAIKKYEVIDNIDFILDTKSFYDSVNTSFKNKLTRISPN
ncbi:hypothetical protein [Rhodohalobacter barkolensis]|uniref:Uncharacterized protein n=1 Tax=Rhodohalobacter barkolensis TaxID=2053187 RepID=A0A2N0VHM4_9BACT|nr:hypothetical protein [Rhodohalobacter barkolensis]PKD43691.1 hypothetical protein CWD77_09020 [Rhodohalobacter barkolensis]